MKCKRCERWKVKRLGLCQKCLVIPAARKPCQHCKTRDANRPKQLCWTCYQRPGVKEQYASTSKYAQKRYRAAELADEKEPTMEELEKLIAENYPTMPGYKSHKRNGVKPWTVPLVKVPKNVRVVRD